MKKLTSYLFITVLFVSFSLKAVTGEGPLWLRYASISPDGKKIAFCYRGDIFIVESSGGNALQLTSSEANDFYPIWSPDGNKIAFASDRHGNYDLFIVASSGGNSNRLTHHSASDIPSTFSPDGKEIYYTSSRLDVNTSYHSPASRLSECYMVSVDGGREKMVFSHPAEELKISADGKKMMFIDNKGFEDKWRKHHTSSVTRDIWIYDKTTNLYKMISEFNGEDRNPSWTGAEKEIIYLSEKSGSFNVWKMKTDNPSATEQLTSFTKNPVRFLSVAKDGLMCFAYDGELYTQNGKDLAKKVNIKITTDDRYELERNEIIASDVSEMDVSLDGKEVAFIVRGEVFVTSVEGAMTKRITNTAGMERNIMFSPDGRSVLYSSERNNIWGVYQTSLARNEEKHFFNCTVLKEEALIVGDKESFQPRYSPDGSEIAFLEDRTALKIYNLKSKQSRLILPKEKNYSYTDGDQWYEWSPDGKFLLVNFLEENQWMSEVGLCDASGKNAMINLTKSGYDAGAPKWGLNGKMMIWMSGRNGMKNHASWGMQSDVYGLFFTKEAFDKFNTGKAEFSVLADSESKQKDKKTAAKSADSLKKKDTDKNIVLPELKIDFDDLEERKVRLTIHSADMSDAILAKDGESLFYLAKFEGGYDLWENKFREKETKLIVRLDAGNASMILDKEGKNLFVNADGVMSKINVDNHDKKSISFKAEMVIKPWEERAAMFEHAWRQAREKFYVSDLQKTDWNYYKKTYLKFLPHINNNYDFAELLSEMLGELNASHTGGRYNARHKNADETAALGVFYDEQYIGNGIKIIEMMNKGPFDNSTSLVKEGCIIEKIDGDEIFENTNISEKLNRKVGKNILVSVFDPSIKKRWDEVVKPISLADQNELLYKRWIKLMQKETERLSNGTLGYVHVRGMNDESFRIVYEQALGMYPNCKGLIVDTRYNGGGWLHDDLCTFLSGKDYVTFVPRERKIGHDPAKKWTAKSCVLMSEGNYSDAHMFPYAYKALNIGKLIGMPVAGTGTAVWWETMWDGTIVFGIPQVGVVGMDGKYLENQQLEPDIKVMNDYKEINAKRDQQLEAAIKELLK